MNQAKLNKALKEATANKTKSARNTEGTTTTRSRKKVVEVPVKMEIFVAKDIAGIRRPLRKKRNKHLKAA